MEQRHKKSVVVQSEQESQTAADFKHICHAEMSQQLSTMDVSNVPAVS